VEQSRDLKPALKGSSLLTAFALVGLGLRLYVSYSGVSSYPFALSFSESGRIYDAYRLYAGLLSDARSAFPWLDPARAMLDGLVLFVPGAGMWLYRFWFATLYLATSFGSAFLIVDRAISFLAKDNRHRSSITALRLPLVVCGGLFLFQGPVYYHLLAAVLPILIFYRQDRPGRILVVVAVSAVWAGMTRVNWFLMPALTATTIYFLTEVKGKRTIPQYLQWPVLWGLVNASISIIVYLGATQLAGMPSILESSMRYSFFRAKLWPNPGNPLGLLPGIALISVPYVILVLQAVWRHRRSLHWLRGFSLLALALALGAGSTLVSLRSGGGYDLHNYDTLIFYLLVCGIFAGIGGIALDGAPAEARPALSRPLIVLAVMIIPLAVSAVQVAPPPNYPTEAAKEAIQELNSILAAETDPGSEVLFIDHRHLVIFGLVSAPEINPKYEKIELMEMAMGRNRTFLDRFERDIEVQQYEIIIGPVLWQGIKLPGETIFWDENNVWSEYIAAPILRHYEPLYLNREAALGIYIPIQ
jgi:hypothetical protein